MDQGELAETIADSLFLLPQMAGSCTLLNIPGIRGWISRHSESYANRVRLAGCAGTGQKIQQVCNFFGRLGKGFTWVAGPADIESGLPARLLANGLKPSRFHRLAGMGMNAPYPSFPRNPAVRIQEIPPDQVIAHIDVFARAYGVSREIAGHPFAPVRKTSVIRSRYYLAYFGDCLEPVGFSVSAYIANNSAALLRGPGVVPEHRGKGLYKAMVQCRLGDTAAVDVEVVHCGPEKPVDDADWDAAARAWRAGSERETIYWCQRILAARDHVPLVLFQELASALKRWGRFESALAAGRRGLCDYPDDPGLHQFCAEIALSLDQPDRAISHIQYEIDGGKPHRTHWAVLGQAQAGLGNYAQAIVAYRHALEQNGIFEWHTKLAACLEHTGQFEAAAEQWLLALEMQPKNITARMGLALTFRAAGQLVPALHHCRQAIAVAPYNPEGYFLAIRILLDQEQWDEARAMLASAPPGFDGQLFNPDQLAALYFTLGQMGQAENSSDWQGLFRQSLHVIGQMEEKLPNHFFRAALIHQQLGNAGESIRLFTRILKEAKELNLLYGANFHLGELYYSRNELKEAEAYFSNCLEINPYHRKANEYLSRLRLRSKH